MSSPSNVADIYPLSHTQAGILFHALYEPHSGAYLDQLIFTIHGALDVPAFRQAWQTVIDRHPALRTLFLWENRDTPLQVVRRAAEIELTLQTGPLDDYLTADRARGFDLTRPPLTRLALIQTAPDTHEFIWTYSYLILDGWCLPLLLKEVLTFYEASNHGETLTLPTPRPYRDYLTWLRTRNMDEARKFWAETLRGFTAPTPLPPSPVASLLIDQTETARAVIPTKGRNPYVDPLKISIAGISPSGRNDKSMSGFESITQAAGARSGHQRFYLPPETSRTLETLARQGRLTPNTIMQGAWALLLSRYSGERDVVFGATVSGRPAEIEGVEKMVGVFINTLPVRIRIPHPERRRTEGSAQSKDASTSGRILPRPSAQHDDALLPWLVNIQREQAPIRGLEHSPLIDIQGWSDVPRGQQLFESILVFSNYPQDVPFTEGIDSSLKMDNFRAIEQTSYPLSLLITPGERWLFMLDYHRARLSDETITRLISHLQTLLESMAAAPHSHLSELDWLTPNERSQILDEWNNTGVSYPREAMLHTLIEQQAASTPDKIAVSAGGESLTYRELDERANLVAAHLSALGVGAGSLVGICTRREVGMLIGLLGILKAGAAYIPIDPDYPPARIAYILADSAVHIIVTESQTREQLSSYSLLVTHYLLLDNLAAAPPPQDPAPPRTHPENLCYVIHTSGSTGQPKGVQIPHRAAVNFMVSMAGITSLTAADVLVAVTTLSFDIAGLELYLPVTLGATVVIASREQAADGLALARLLETSGATAMQATPATWRMLVDTGWQGKPGLKILCGGEALPRDLADALLARGASVLNLYGPTETTIWSASHAVGAGAGPVPIGKPIGNTQLYILDDDLRLVPVGVSGSLYIGGEGVARGYLGKPGLTAERFVPNPFFEPEKGQRSGGEEEKPLLTSSPFPLFPSSPRLYKTGDLARWLPSGDVEFLGRADFQVKLRGFRVELEEIELALRAHPAVQGAVVIVREDQEGDQRLTGYVIPVNGAFPVADLRAFLGGSLPPYMIPSNFIFLPQFPLTPNGKIDRKALPAPESARPDFGKLNPAELVEGAAYTPPRSELERTITAIWQEVLRVEQVGVHDNFFDLGGHSLLMVQVFGKLRAALSADLSMVELFRFPTVRAMAESLGGERAAPPSRADASADRAALRRAAIGRRRG